MDLVDALVEDDRWHALDLAALADGAARAALAELGLDPAGFQIALLATDDGRIAGLNAEFRGRLSATNVLSWPAETRGAASPGQRPDLPDGGSADDPADLGDIALAWETCVREADEGGLTLADHLTHLIVHAVLHLLGYDHGNDADAALMEAVEVRALARLGVADPY